MQVEGVLSRREVWGLKRPVGIFRADEFDLAAALLERGSDDGEAAPDGLEVRPCDIDEHVSRVGCELGQYSVDDWREAQHVPLRIRDDREDRLRGDQVRVLPPFFVLYEDVQQVHF